MSDQYLNSENILGGQAFVLMTGVPTDLRKSNHKFKVLTAANATEETIEIEPIAPTTEADFPNATNDVVILENLRTRERIACESYTDAVAPANDTLDNVKRGASANPTHMKGLARSANHTFAQDMNVDDVLFVVGTIPHPGKVGINMGVTGAITFETESSPFNAKNNIHGKRKSWETDRNLKGKLSLNWKELDEEQLLKMLTTLFVVNNAQSGSDLLWTFINDTKTLVVRDQKINLMVTPLEFQGVLEDGLQSFRHSEHVPNVALIDKVQTKYDSEAMVMEFEVDVYSDPVVGSDRVLQPLYFK